jgi:two-component system, cell cycle sensor histidine kinase and response regulator CckA
MPAQHSLSRLLSILVVQHDKADANLCIRALEKLGYPVHTDVASSREEFERHVRLHNHDIVLSDYRMPEWTGLDALSFLRSIGSDAPFLLVTGALGDEIAVECIKQGVTDYVSKDRLARLPIAVERALGERLLRKQCDRAEEMQRRSETGLQLLFSNNPLPMYVYDLQTFRFLQVNDAAVAFYGFSHEEFSRMSFFDIRCADENSMHPAAPIDSAQTVWFAGEWRHQKKNGEVADVSVIRHLIQHYGRDAGLGVVQDITARKNNEQEITSRACQQAALAEMARRALEGLDLDATFHETARMVAETLGVDLCGVFDWNPADSHLVLRAGIGWKPDILSSAAVNNIRNSELGCALLQTEPIVIEDAQHETRYERSPLLATNGVMSSMAIVIPGVARPFGVLSAHSKTRRVFRRHEIEFLQSVAQFFAAVIARRRSEQALQASEARHREFVEHTPYGVYRANMFGKFVDVNPALVRMLGYSSAEELVAKPLSAIYGKVEDTDLLISQYAEAGVVSGVEIPWKRKDTSTIIVRLAGRAVPDSTGNPLNLEIIVQDVTERRELEKQLRQAQKFEAIGQLAGGIAHDFNNVLGAVIGWAELGLEQASDRPRLREYFKKIGDQASRAAGLTRQLLAFARRQVLAPQNIQINGVVTGIFGLLESILGKNIQIETKLCKQPAGVRADPTQLEQVLMNLCLNARDAMPQGGLLSIETKISQVPDELQIQGFAHGSYVQLIVTDTGTGMDAGTREHIFEPFFTTKEPGKGTGLGLATVFGIVNQHDGYIKVISEPGHGSTFDIALPCVPAEPLRAKPSERQRETVRGGSEILLLAETHEGVREIARVALERAGYRVLIANDGLNAIEQFRANSGIALVVMDLVMPRMGGHAAIAQMRALRPDFPVIFTTGYSAESAAIVNAQDGRDVVLQKPYETCLLLRHVRELLDKRSLHAMLDTMSSDVLFRHSEGA